VKVSFPASRHVTAASSSSGTGYEVVVDAIAREKQIKGGSRKKKLALIEMLNPQWHDLYEQLE